MAAVAECVTLTCRTCGESKPAARMAVDHGRPSTECKACRNTRKKALVKAKAAVYPCPGCERYQACVTRWAPCAEFKAYVEAAC